MRASGHRHQVPRYYDWKVRLKTFEPGDLVLKRVFPPSTQLGPKWEGPYTIQRKLDTGAFKLTIVTVKRFLELGMLSTYDDI